jgi:carboxysome shell carbonic anhydrase
MKRAVQRRVPQSGTFWQRHPVLPPVELRAAAAAAPLPPGAASAASRAASHPLAEPGQSLKLRQRAQEIDAAFARIEPTLRALALRQFDDSFAARVGADLEAALGFKVPAAMLHTDWARPLDLRRLYARCVLETFCQLITRRFDRGLAQLSEGESAALLIQRWGFHAIDITPCADGRLSGVVDYILRVPPSVVAYRTSCAGASFDVEESLRHWEAVELRRWREGVPNAADSPTRYLKIGVYHFSSIDPLHAGCAAHGSDTGKAAASLAERLHQFDQAVQSTHCCGASVATLLIGVDTDTDAIRMHVPDGAGVMHIDRYVDNLALYDSSLSLPREAAKEAIRQAVADCAGVQADDAATTGMRWFCGYLLKNNMAQIDAVRDWHGASYGDRGHTERLIIVGDAVDDVQLRNLAFQAQMDTVEEGAPDLDVGVHILEHVHGARDLPVPVLVHFRYDPRIPGSRQRAGHRARRLQAAIEARYGALWQSGGLYVQSVIRALQGVEIDEVERSAEAAA